MRRSILVVLLASLMVMAMGASAAFAGEWNKGHFNAPGGDLPAKFNANSECMFSGQDEHDSTEGVIPFSDDFFWSNTPVGLNNQAGIRVQSPGLAYQLGLASPGDAGVACNGHLHPLK